MPAWVTIRDRAEGSLSVATAGAHPSGEPLRNYDLCIAEGSYGVLAREQVGGGLLPDNCLQRHMNTDGSFCIGYGAPREVVDLAGGERWWSLLLGYLQCQDIAQLTRRWPPNRGLSHGDAAALQLEAESLANKLGLLTQYREAVEYGISWPPDNIPESPELNELLELESRRRKEDHDFLRYVYYPCCRTMDGCPIASR